ncbi:MAG: hypothetical protein ABH952_08235, partial [Candidatus Omnitrophota bacterium]
ILKLTKYDAEDNKMVKKKEGDKVLEEIKRHNKVLMEHMEKQVKTVAEQYGSMMNKLEDHDEKFERIGSELETVKMAVLENSRKIDRVEKKLDTNIANHKKRITKIEEKVGV